MLRPSVFLTPKAHIHNESTHVHFSWRPRSYMQRANAHTIPLDTPPSPPPPDIPTDCGVEINIEVFQIIGPKSLCARLAAMDPEATSKSAQSFLGRPGHRGDETMLQCSALQAWSRDKTRPSLCERLAAQDPESTSKSA